MFESICGEWAKGSVHLRLEIAVLNALQLSLPGAVRGSEEESRNKAADEVRRRYEREVA